MELKMKKEELELETMRKQITAGRDMQNTDDKQQQAVKRPFQSTSLQVCIILNPSIFLSIMSRSQNLLRPMFINATIKGHKRLPYFSISQIARIFSTYIENIQEISKGEASRFPWNITSTWKTKLYAKER
jgi:hypothetical protein